MGASRKPLKETKPVKARAANGAESELRVPAVRNGRASSCPRCPQRHGCERSAGAQRTAFRTSCERRTRSSSTTANWPRANPATNSVRHAAVNPKSRELSACPSQREQRSVKYQR